MLRLSTAERPNVVVERVLLLAVELDVPRPDQRLCRAVVDRRLRPSDQVGARIALLGGLLVVLLLGRLHPRQNRVIVLARGILVADVTRIAVLDHGSPGRLVEGLAGREHHAEHVGDLVRRVAPPFGQDPLRFVGREEVIGLAEIERRACAGDGNRTRLRMERRIDRLELGFERSLLLLFALRRRLRPGCRRGRDKQKRHDKRVTMTGLHEIPFP
jgi:hypothetical protein